MTTHHLVAVWNPACAANAMEAHLSVLLSRVRDWRDKRGDEDGIYVWWGKIRSENRQQRLKAVALGEDSGELLEGSAHRFAWSTAAFICDTQLGTTRRYGALVCSGPCS